MQLQLLTSAEGRSGKNGYSRTLRHLSIIVSSGRMSSKRRSTMKPFISLPWKTAIFMESFRWFTPRAISFGNILCSMPFLNFGGVCADSNAAYQCLLDGAHDLLIRKNADYVEFRHLHPSPF